jgi:hypothetical protein
VERYRGRLRSDPVCMLYLSPFTRNSRALTSIEQLLFVDFVLYDIAILGPKVAILLQLKDIFAPRMRNGFYWAAIFLISANVVFYIALSFALIFQCNPVARGWDPTVPGQCLNQDALLESSGPFNIISDFLIFLLPISAIWQLQLPIRTRGAVASAFAVGLLYVPIPGSQRRSANALFQWMRL